MVLCMSWHQLVCIARASVDVFGVGKEKDKHWMCATGSILYFESR